MQAKNFIYETHGVHTGTENDVVKHGVDDIEAIVEKAINLGHPNITFIIHTPRLTNYRYLSEENTDIKFIRGGEAYQNYAKKISKLKAQYADKINIRYGIELEYMGCKLGLQWNRSKLLLAPDVDFVIGSVHFSREGLPYDGSKEEAQKLLQMRGGLENYWAGYFEELIEMISTSSDMINVVGHLDLPKLNMEFPEEFFDLDNGDNLVVDRLRTLLEIISENNLALDLNVAGEKKGCGIYPNKQILTRAKRLKIPVAIGTDTHALDDYGLLYNEGIGHAKAAGYSQYLSFCQGMLEIRPFDYKNEEDVNNYTALNLSIEILNRRFPTSDSGRIPRFSFGGKYGEFLQHFDGSVSLGNISVIRARRERKSIMLGSQFCQKTNENEVGILSHHLDEAGVLSVLFNTLASEGINVKTAFVNSKTDGTAEAFLTVSGAEKGIKNAIEFAKGTGKNKFLSIEFGKKISTFPVKKSEHYLLEMDGVKLPIPISKQMILAVIENKPGTLLVLLSALASREINIIDLQLGERGDKGYVALSVEGNFAVVEEILRKLGSQYYETTHFEL